jgi:hypothetical protein
VPSCEADPSAGRNGAIWPRSPAKINVWLLGITFIQRHSIRCSRRFRQRYESYATKKLG